MSLGTYGNADQVMLTLIESIVERHVPSVGVSSIRGLTMAHPKELRRTGCSSKVRSITRCASVEIHSCDGLGNWEEPVREAHQWNTPLSPWTGPSFDATIDSTGRELFARPRIGSIRLADIAPGTSGSNPARHVTRSQRDTSSSTPPHHQQARNSCHDSSNGSTWLVQDINQGSTSSNPGRLMCKVHDGVLYFDATTSSTGTEMWATITPI